jgi:amidase
VRDAAALLDITAGAMPGDPYYAEPPRQPFSDALAAPPPHLHIGVMRRPPRDRDFELHSECLSAVDRAARQLAELGHRVEESHPEALDDPIGMVHFITIVAANVARTLDAWAEKVGRPVGPSDVEPLTWVTAERGRERSAGDLLASIEYTHALGRRVAAWWIGGFDLLLTPSTAQPPPPLGYLSGTAQEPFRPFMRAGPFGAYTSAFNMTGQPAISLPLHQTAEGLPLGVQLVAAYGREDLLLRVAAQLEHALPWRDRRPAIHA